MMRRVAAPTKTDLKREIATYRAPRGRFEIVDVAPARFWAIDGQGDPNTAERYRDALATLYPAAYATKALCRRDLGRDHVVMPLEALWWADAMRAFTSARDKEQWCWTVMILVPAWVSDEHVEQARSAVADRAPLISDLRVEELDEGRAVQTLHVGPYDEEGPVLERMHHEFVPTHDLTMTGRHHEIYLGDPRRTAPERLRTILRQPVRAS